MHQGTLERWKLCLVVLEKIFYILKVCAVGFEPNKKHTESLKKLEERYNQENIKKLISKYMKIVYSVATEQSSTHWQELM